MAASTPPAGTFPATPGPVWPLPAAPDPGLVWSAAEARAFDAWLSQEAGIPNSCLMENAAASLAFLVRRLLAAEGAIPEPREILWIAGPGNNGGDALVALRQLLGEPGLEHRLILPLGPPREKAPDARRAWEQLRTLGLRAEAQFPDPQEPPWLLVDGLFGTGLRRPLEGAAVEAVARARSLREAGSRVLAADLPSGLDADRGTVLGAILPADDTLQFAACKRGALEPGARTLCGRLWIAGIGVSLALGRAWAEARRRGEALPPPRASGS